MKKRAFTMAEIIITLAVIAVGAVIIAPAVTNIMPDKNKAKIIKYNTLLGNAINDMFQNEELYKPIRHYNVDTNVIEDRRGIDAIDNFVVNLRNALNINPDTNIGPDNSRWIISHIDPPSNDEIRFLLQIDLKPNKNGCIYSSNCRRPRDVDTYSFTIDSEGSVIPNDNLTRAYLSNPLVLNNREADFEKAASY